MIYDMQPAKKYNSILLVAEPQGISPPAGGGILVCHSISSHTNQPTSDQVRGGAIKKRELLSQLLFFLWVVAVRLPSSVTYLLVVVAQKICDSDERLSAVLTLPFLQSPCGFAVLFDID